MSTVMKHKIFNNNYILSVRTRFDLNPKTGMDPGPRSPNNEFIECRKES